MISKAICTSVRGAENYFKSHLNAADYFVEKEKAERGYFIGKVAERLGLEGAEVTRERFRAFVECDVEALGASSGRPRTSEIKYIEFTYSAPKAVSVVAALDDRVKGELYAAVKEELDWFETLVDVRDRRGELFNGEEKKATGEMFAALFQHETSRTNDPDFHVHTLVGNVTWDEERKQYLAVHYGRMLELRKTLDFRIHNNLAARMAKLGYHVEPAKFGFGLKEVPLAAVDMFSERAIQIDNVKTLFKRGYSPAQIAKALKGVNEKERKRLLSKAEFLAEKIGRPEGPSRLKIDHVLDQQAATLTRPKKVRISSKTLREDVGKRLQKAGLVVEAPAASPVKVNLSIEEAIKQGTQIAFEKESVVRLELLHGEIIRLAPGVVSNDELMKQLRDDRRFLIRQKDGHELVTTKAILSEEKTLLTTVVRGMNQKEPLNQNYEPPASLVATPERIDELLAQARARGEELTRAQAEKWLNQFATIHHYVCTSTDQYLNIRGGAGTGKTVSLELLVNESLRAGRSVFLCAPYGEQSRVNLRNEASRIEAAGQTEVARIFAEANTVDHLILKARDNPSLFCGADIYVDEAGLLDTPKALALVTEAERVGARVIFQGDTEQMAAVGRGQPIKLLQDELGLGMHVPRASISRRQLSTEDKKLAADLSSGDDERFAGAVQKMLDRGMICETAPDSAVEEVAKEIVEARASGKEIVAVSSVHRISEALAERIHSLHVEKNGSGGQGFLDVHVKRDLQPTELQSSQFYRVGDVVEFKDKGSGSVVRAPVTAVLPNAVVIGCEDQPKQVPLTQVRAVFDSSRMERGPGERLLLQEKIKQGEKVFEKGSRQIISEIKDGTVHFKSGLKLAVNDGRVRQGDCLTDYKAQGLKGVQVRGIEDNGSASSMANKEAFHVKGTRHVDNLKLHVENKAFYVEMIQRSNGECSALHLERQPDKPALSPLSPKADKTALVMKAFQWGKEFTSRFSIQKITEQVRLHLARFEAMRSQVVETPSQKVEVKEAAAVKETVKETVIEKQVAVEKPAPVVKPAVQQKPDLIQKVLDHPQRIKHPLKVTPAMKEIVKQAMPEKLLQQLTRYYANHFRPSNKMFPTAKELENVKLERPKHSQRFTPNPPSQRQGPHMGM